MSDFPAPYYIQDLITDIPGRMWVPQFGTKGAALTSFFLFEIKIRYILTKKMRKYVGKLSFDDSCFWENIRKKTQCWWYQIFFHAKFVCALLRLGKYEISQKKDICWVKMTTEREENEQFSNLGNYQVLYYIVMKEHSKGSFFLQSYQEATQ